MGRVSFFRRHLWAGIGLLLGPAIAIGSLVMHAYALIELGLPVEVWVAIGLTIYFLSGIGILYKQHQYFNAGAPQTEGTQRIPAVTSTPPVPSVANIHPREAQNNERIFTNITVQDLFNMYQGRSFVEGERLVAPYLNKWIRITDTVTNVSVSEADRKLIE